MSTVKLEVGAWYGVLIRDRVEFGQRVDKDRYYIPDCAEIKNFKDSMVSGPYRIEPGDVVKPKPRQTPLHRSMGEREFVCVKHPYNKDWVCAPALDSSGLMGYPISDLILVRKAEKAKPQFYRGKDDPLICVDCFNREQTKGKLNPATLPSLLGGEQTWPDVKPGALLDTLPMNMHTTEDELVARDSDYQVCRMGDALGCIENIELGIVNNADRERIRKIIPEIERKLTQLKGRL